MAHRELQGRMKLANQQVTIGSVKLLSSIVSTLSGLGNNTPVEYVSRRTSFLLRHRSEYAQLLDFVRFEWVKHTVLTGNTKT